MVKVREFEILCCESSSLLEDLPDLRWVTTCNKRKVNADKSLEPYKAASDVTVTELPPVTPCPPGPCPQHLRLLLRNSQLARPTTVPAASQSKLSTTPSPSSTPCQKRDTKIQL
ncbi:hypothetical protein C8R44DRAFT_745524 [Mycena epipterygia]|nr:hypothetical protein C8R44DRAFT_745524 [Mycena epipterygia]